MEREMEGGMERDVGWYGEREMEGGMEGEMEGGMERDRWRVVWREM